jgi:pimeloyl-ACP methyl ester carboxylesterase
MTLRHDPQLQRFVESVVSELEDPISRDGARSLVRETSSGNDTPELFDLLVEDVLAVPHVWKKTFAGLLSNDDQAELPLIEAPTLLVWVDADTLVSRDLQHQLAHSIPEASLCVYAGVGHTPRWE